MPAWAARGVTAGPGARMSSTRARDMRKLAEYWLDRIQGATGGRMRDTGSDWLNSAEVRKVLKISTCVLAHMREDGAIRAEKRGNAYYYCANDVETLRGRKLKKGAESCRLGDAHR